MEYALGAAAVDELQEAIGDVAKARVVQMRGSGRAVCAGSDLKGRAGMEPAARVACNRAINAPSRSGD